MKNKSNKFINLAVSSLLAGTLVSSHAFAGDDTHTDTNSGEHADKNSCKGGEKDSCKGKEKESCAGKDGCGGKE